MQDLILCPVKELMWLQPLKRWLKSTWLTKWVTFLIRKVWKYLPKWVDFTPHSRRLRKLYPIKRWREKNLYPFCLNLTSSNSQWDTIENIHSCSTSRANEDPKLKKRRYCSNLLSTFIALLLIILICFCCPLAVVSNYNLFWPRDELFDTCRSIQRHLRKGLSSARHFYCHDASRRQSQSDPNDPTGLFNRQFIVFPLVDGP